LGVGVSLLGSFAKPPYGLHLVLRDAFSIDIVKPQVVLGRGMPLLGSVAVPLHGLHLVLCHAFSVGVAKP